ncbi:hypothetical protein EV561_1212 [Rhizobium sp. BK376]|nr:hypothetical protein EV561_1212 [Rhizobium sp. BK376]
MATGAQGEALRGWLIALLELRERDMPKLLKAKEAIAITAKSKVIWPLVSIIGKEMKRLGWDERTSSQRWGLGGAAAGIALFGGQGAGIAALGTAVGVPLWIVLGAGSMFARTVLGELAKKREAASGGVTYTVLDAEPEDGSKI